MKLSPKQQAQLIFDAVLAEFPNLGWLDAMAAQEARKRLSELSETQCQRMIAKARLILDGQ